MPLLMVDCCLRLNRDDVSDDGFGLFLFGGYGGRGGMCVFWDLVVR